MRKQTEDCSKGVAGNCKGRGGPERLAFLMQNLEIEEAHARTDTSSHDSDLERM